MLVGCDRQAIESIVEVIPAYLASKEGSRDGRGHTDRNGGAVRGPGRMETMFTILILRCLWTGLIFQLLL